MNITPARRRALESVGDWGGIDAIPAVFRWVKDHELVAVDRKGFVTLTDKGRAVIGGQS